MMLELNFQVFPSAIFQIYMVFVLQQDGLEYYISILSSLIGVIMGASGAVIYSRKGQSLSIKKKICCYLWCYLSACTDIIFRILFISFFSSLYSPYASLAIPLIYFLCFFLVLFFRNCRKLTPFEFLSCVYTLPTSNYEDKVIKYSLRPKSKVVFNTIALIGLVLITLPFWKSDPIFEEKNLPKTNRQPDSIFDHCKDICHKKELDVCSSFSLSEQIFHIVYIALWILWFISTLEVLLEYFFKCMPHRQFCKELKKETQDGNTENPELEEPLNA